MRVLTRTCPKCRLDCDISLPACPRDGSPLAPDAAFDPAFKDKYIFLDTLGSGGMGVVYKAHDVRSDRTVAIKTLHPLDPNATNANRFKTEVDILSRLRHPNIVSPLHYGATAAGEPFLVMEYIEGSTLADVLASEGQLSTPRFLDIFLQACSALGHAHSMKILHRDIKPSNLMISRQNNGLDHVYLMDFGVGKLLTDGGPASQRLTQTGQLIGTPTYMSPEQAQGLSLDERSDLYSLGCIMYEALTGTPPFVSNSALGTMLQHRRDAPLSIPEASMGRTVDKGLEETVLKLLEKDPAQRYQSTDELRRSLLSVRRTATPHTAHSTATQSAKTKPIAYQPSRSERQIQSIALTVLLLSCVLLMGAIAYKAAMVTFDKKAANTQLNDAPKPEESLPSQTNTTPATANGSPSVEHETAPPVVPTAFSEVATQLAPQELNEAEANIREIFDNVVKTQTATLDLAEGFRMFIQDGDLKVLSKAKSLRKLDLEDARAVTDKGLEYLSQLKLVDLSLENTKVKDLHALKGMTSLVSLDLFETPIDKNALKVIHTLTSLQSLSLMGTKISDSDLQYLYSLNKLKTLQLQSCRVSLPAIKQLQQALPECTVWHNWTPGVGKKFATKLVEEAEQLLREKRSGLALQKLDQCVAVASRDPSVSPDRLADRIIKNAELRRRLGRDQESLRDLDSAEKILNRGKENLTSNSLQKLSYQIASTICRLGIKERFPESESRLKKLSRDASDAQLKKDSVNSLLQLLHLEGKDQDAAQYQQLLTQLNSR